MTKLSVRKAGRKNWHKVSTVTRSTLEELILFCLQKGWEYKTSIG